MAERVRRDAKGMLRGYAVNVGLLLIIAYLAFQVGAMVGGPAPGDPWAGFDIHEAAGVFADIDGDGEIEFLIDARFLEGAELDPQTTVVEAGQ